MANNSHPVFYFPFHSFISLGAATLHIIVSTNQVYTGYDYPTFFAKIRYDSSCTATNLGSGRV